MKKIIISFFIVLLILPMSVLASMSEANIVDTTSTASNEILLEAITNPTKLVNGRLNSSYAKSITGNASSAYIADNEEFDKEHKTARVKLSENAVASWWGLRNLEFKLSDGVKFLQVKISNEENFEHIDNTHKLDGEYNLSATKADYVTLSSDKLEISNLQVKRDKSMSMEIDIWVSIESGFEGDIMLSIGGNHIKGNVAPIKIASAVSPVTIETNVKGVKIGYIWQKVADVTITETETGMLQKDKEVILTVNDGIKNYLEGIFFGPDFTTEVNIDSNIAISKPIIKDGDIGFIIEKASDNVPAYIKFSNLYVKIDDTVPETNKRPVRVIAAGTAIAANYREHADVLSIEPYHPLFELKGIGIEYLNVITPRNNCSNVFDSTIVRVTSGSNEVVVGKDGATTKLQMDTAAYISDSNAVMVPVRFVSQAFGIPDSQIVWSEEDKSIAILGGSNGTVRFKLGCSQISVGGSTFTMYSPDNYPTKIFTEVKDNRAFLPFRQLGNALGADADWDDSTKTAVYNARLLEYFREKDNMASDIE